MKETEFISHFLARYECKLLLLPLSFKPTNLIILTSSICPNPLALQSSFWFVLLQKLSGEHFLVLLTTVSDFLLQETKWNKKKDFPRRFFLSLKLKSFLTLGLQQHNHFFVRYTSIKNQTRLFKYASQQSSGWVDGPNLKKFETKSSTFLVWNARKNLCA